MDPTAVGAVKPHVVIVGGGFGGLEVARTLRDAAVRITLIDRSNHHLFQPLLYQVATAGLSPADIAAPIRNILRDQKDVEVIMAEVTGVDKQGRRVLMGSRSLHYDYLVLATGARDAYFGHDEWEEFAPGLKSIPQATDIRRRILLAFEQAEAARDQAQRQSLLTFVLVGGGPTGVEMAGAIAELAHKALAADFRHIDPRMARIILIEASPRILGTFSESLSRKSKRMLEKLGVEVREGQRVECIDAEGVIVGGARIVASNVIWAAGVRASPAGEWLGVEADRAGRVKVLDDCRVPDFPEIFVIGDTMTMQQNGKPLPGVAQVAIQQGHYVGRAIIRKVEQEPGIVGPFHYVDKGNLATVGRAFAILESGKIKLSGFVAWFVWLAIHIFFLIGFRNRAVVLLQWAWAYVTYQRGARLITNPVPVASPAPTADSPVGKAETPAADSAPAAAPAYHINSAPAPSAADTGDSTPAAGPTPSASPAPEISPVAAGSPPSEAPAASAAPAAESPISNGSSAHSTDAAPVASQSAPAAAPLPVSQAAVASAPAPADSSGSGAGSTPNSRTTAVVSAAGGASLSSAGDHVSRNGPVSGGSAHPPVSSSAANMSSASDAEPKRRKPASMWRN